DPMPPSRMRGVLAHLRQITALASAATPTDGQLLGQYVERHDGDAFAALLKRHGPMVWGVCRRILRNPHDAEDAFQATFLVLVRRAAAVRPRDLVANWLHGVARRTALKARASVAKRQARDRALPVREAAPENDWTELHALLDQ